MGAARRRLGAPRLTEAGGSCHRESWEAGLRPPGGVAGGKLPMPGCIGRGTVGRRPCGGRAAAGPPAELRGTTACPPEPPLGPPSRWRTLAVHRANLAPGGPQGRRRDDRFARMRPVNSSNSNRTQVLGWVVLNVAIGCSPDAHSLTAEGACGPGEPAEIRQAALSGGFQSGTVSRRLGPLGSRLRGVSFRVAGVPAPNGVAHTVIPARPEARAWRLS